MGKDGGRTDERTNEEGIIYGRGKEPGGQNNSGGRKDGHGDAKSDTDPACKLYFSIA